MDEETEEHLFGQNDIQLAASFSWNSSSMMPSYLNQVQKKKGVKKTCMQERYLCYKRCWANKGRCQSLYCP